MRRNFKPAALAAGWPDSFTEAASLAGMQIVAVVLGGMVTSRLKVSPATFHEDEILPLMES